MTRKVKGMVNVAGVTYRIVRIKTGAYSAVRIHDDREVGSFTTSPVLVVNAQLIGADLLRDVARVAIQAAKTSSVGIPAPTRAATESTAAACAPALSRRVPVPS